MDIEYWTGIARLGAWIALTALIVCLALCNWRWDRRNGRKQVDHREFWRYGKGGALDERYRAIELLEVAARGCDAHGLADQAQGLRDAASLIAQPQLVDSYAPRNMVLPYWLADYVRDHRARAALFGERKDSDDSGN